jgi:entericidin B
MKKFVFALLAAATLLSAVGCNTVQGIGKDIERGGEAIQRSTK